MKIKLIFFFTLLCVAGVSFGQSYNNITGKNNFTDSVRLSKYKGSKIDSSLTVNASGNLIFVPRNAGGGGYGVDSITINPQGMLCAWSIGLSTCYPLGKYYDSAHLNADSSYIRFFNVGNLVDSVWLRQNPIVARDGVGIKDTVIDGKRAFVFYGTGTGGGGSGGRLDTVYATPDSAYLVFQYISGFKDSLQWGGGSGTIIASNLLTKTGSDIQLGGSATKNDTLDLNGFRLSTKNGKLEINTISTTPAVDYGIFQVNDSAGIPLLYADPINHITGAAIWQDGTYRGEISVGPVGALIQSNSADGSNQTATVYDGINGAIDITATNQIRVLTGKNFLIKDSSSTTSSNGFVFTLMDNITGRGAWRYNGGGGGSVTDTALNFIILDSLNTPPVSPVMGDVYEVGTSPTGVWAGHATQVATWNGTIWAYQTPTTGNLLLNGANYVVSKFNGSAWVRIGKYVIHNGGDPLPITIGTTSASTFSFMSGGAVRANLSSGGVWQFNAPYNGTGVGTLQVNNFGQMFRGSSLDSIWRTPGQDSIKFSINGRLRSIKDSTGGGGSTYTVAAPITLTGSVIGADTSAVVSALVTQYQRKKTSDSLLAIINSRWSLTGNAGTTAGTNFIGTTDAQDLIFKRNSLTLGSFGARGFFADSMYIGRGSGKGFNKASVGIGDSVLMKVTTAQRVTAVGDSAAVNLTTGSDNVFMGSYAGQSFTTQGSIVAIGPNAMQTATGANQTGVGNNVLKVSTGASNTAVGNQAGLSNSSGTNNSFFGENAGVFNTTGSANFFGGVLSGFHNTSGSNNIGIGNNAMAASTTGGFNIAIGVNSLSYANASNNIAIGFEAVDSTTSGFSNVGLGSKAMHNNTSGYENTSLGNSALYYNTTGARSIGIGSTAGALLLNNITPVTQLDSCLMFGNNAHPFAATGNLGQIVIGNNAVSLGNYTTAIGASNNTRVGMYGNMELLGIGNKLIIPTGTNASVGSATLVAGTVTVSTTAVTTASKIFVTVTTPGGTQGFPSVPTISIVNGTSFTINSTSSSETSVVNWWIIN